MQRFHTEIIVVLLHSVYSLYLIHLQLYLASIAKITFSFIRFSPSDEIGYYICGIDTVYTPNNRYFCNWKLLNNNYMGTRKIICMGSLFFLSVAIPYERQTSIRGGCSRTIWSNWNWKARRCVGIYNTCTPHSRRSDRNGGIKVVCIFQAIIGKPTKLAYFKTMDLNGKNS